MLSMRRASRTGASRYAAPFVYSQHFQGSDTHISLLVECVPSKHYADAGDGAALAHVVQHARREPAEQPDDPVGGLGCADDARGEQVERAAVLCLGRRVADGRPVGRGPDDGKFLIVAIDYFTKWVEAELLAKITEANCTNFIFKNIICRFGLPHSIVTDNGK